LVLELHKFDKQLSHAEIKQKTGINQETESYLLSEEAQQICDDWHKKQPVSAKTVRALITELEACKANSPVITITLASPATILVKKTLVDWCRSNISSDILINITVSRNILGGMVVRFGSHIHDWSFKRKLIENKDEFSKVLRRV